MNWEKNKTKQKLPSDYKISIQTILIKYAASVDVIIIITLRWNVNREQWIVSHYEN